jgi:DNA-binding NtrC family response regulator
MMSEFSARPASILVVDDHRDTLNVYAAMLRMAGYAPVTANNLAEAKALCRSRPFDLVIADYELGDGQGSELISHSDPHSPRAGIIVTGQGKSEGELRLVAPGWAGHLCKIISPERLIGTVALALGGRDAGPAATG